MLIPISINADDLMDQFNISKKETEDIIDYTVKEITAAFAVKWEEEARLQLKSTRERYVNNIRVVDEGRMSGAVILDYSKDPLIKMIEEGASAFDMKEGFSKSDKKHIKANGDGWYLTIPFKIGTPGASETSGFATILPSQVYNLVKNKPIQQFSDKSKGLMKSEIPEPYAIPKVRAAIVVPKSKSFEAYTHKSSIFQGVFKQTDVVTGQNTYGSFRRVSDKSDDNSWIFPGLESKNIAESAMDKFDTTMQTTLETAMDSALSYFGLTD